MPNLETFARALNLPLSQGNVTAETAFAASSGGTTRALVQIEDSQSFIDGQPFRVQAVVRPKSGGAINYTFAIYANLGGNTNLTTFTNDAKIATSGAQAMGSTTNLIFLSAVVVWDSVTKQLAGYMSDCFSNLATPAVLNSGALTIASTNPIGTSVAGLTSLQFFVTGLFGSSNANNAASLLDFSLTQF